MTIEKIAKALGVEVADLVAGEDLDVNTADKSLMEKLRYLEQLKKKKSPLSLHCSIRSSLRKN